MKTETETGETKTERQREGSFLLDTQDIPFALLTPQDEDKQTERDRKTERGFLVAGYSVTFFLFYFSEQATPPPHAHTRTHTHTHPTPPPLPPM